jgi:hypothetical protein
MPGSGLLERPYIGVASFTHNGVIYLADQYAFSDRATLATTPLSVFLNNLVAEAHTALRNVNRDIPTTGIIALTSGLSNNQPILSVSILSLTATSDHSGVNTLQARAVPVEQLLATLNIDFIP